MAAMTLELRDRVTPRERAFGIFQLLLALLTLTVFARAEGTATFTLNGRNPVVELPPLELPVGPTVIAIGAALVVIGLVQVVRGTQGRAVGVLATGSLLFVLAFLTWAAADGSLNLVELLRVAVRQAVPLTLGALCGAMCERAGVINIAIEGQLLVGALAGVVFSALGGPVLGLAAAIVAAVLLGSILGWLSVKFHADQIIVGVVLIVFASGLTAFIVKLLPADLNASDRFGSLSIPVLADIPIVGPVLFGQGVMVYAMFVAVALVWWILFRSRWGLRIRAVGEHPEAADSVGIDVHRVRLQSVLFGSVLAGIGGAYFTLDSAGQFTRDMSAGKGFIALAALLVGRYHPVGALGAALVFGFADALATGLGLLSVPIPAGVLRTAPYVVTLFVVAGVVGRIRVPAADGKPYVKD